VCRISIFVLSLELHSQLSAGIVGQTYLVRCV
jgi:hypothetical protein